MTTRMKIMAAAGFAAVMVAMPAHAATCATDVATQTGVTFVSCVGGYSGNVLNNANNSTINAALTALGYAGPAISYSAIGAGDIKSGLNGNLNVDFQTLLNGTAYVGVHYGFQGGGATVFYKLTTANVDILKFASGSGGGSTSTATLLVLNATSPVPEPATWTMMIGGFGAMGVAMRRRGNAARRVRYA